MPEETRPSRRSVISAGAVAALGAGALAACGSDPATPVAAEAATTTASETGSIAAATTQSAAAPTSAAPSTTEVSARTTRATTKTSSEPDETTSTTTSTKTTTKTTTKTSKPPQPVDATLAEIPVGGCVMKTVGGRKVVLSQPRSGSVVAFDAACTHQGCPVAAAGRQLTCSCHGSAFNSTTGAVEKGPATRPLARVRATVHDGGVSIG